MTRFLILDVFTDTPFGGNQLAVIPDATELPEDRLQRIAREFNFSETTFVYPADDPANTARVRIFTPMSEVPFAGHPLIGTAVALSGLGRGNDMTLELGIGPIRCSADDAQASFVTEAPLARSHSPAPEHVASCLGLKVEDIRTDRLPPVMAGLGLEFALVELTSQEALDRAHPITDAFQTAARIYPGPLDFAIMAYVRDGNRIDARMFAPLDNIPEDPATGSASAALAALLAEEDGEDLALTISQGVAMGRPSIISAEATLENGKSVSVRVAGNAVLVADGHLTLT